MTQEALKLALEALEEIALAGMSGTGQESERAMTEWHARQAWKFIGIAARQRTAIKEALREHALREVQRLGQEIEQEPVVGITAIRTWFKDGRVVTQTLCNSWVDTTPPQRTWVGLTDEEYDEIWRMDLNNKDIMDKTIAKLKQKNHVAQKTNS